MSTVHMFCWLMTLPSAFSSVGNFCQIAPLHSNAVWMTRVLHLICKAHTHILLFGSKFYILAMYVQMLDIYRKYRKRNLIILIFFIFSKISQYFPTLIMKLTWHIPCFLHIRPRPEKVMLGKRFRLLECELLLGLHCSLCNKRIVRYSQDGRFMQHWNIDGSAIPGRTLVVFCSDWFWLKIKTIKQKFQCFVLLSLLLRKSLPVIC